MNDGQSPRSRPTRLNHVPGILGIHFMQEARKSRRLPGSDIADWLARFYL
jgi:hypothetical protein